MWIFLISGLAHSCSRTRRPFRFCWSFSGQNAPSGTCQRPTACRRSTSRYDDGPKFPRSTPALLDVLAEQDVSATFFVIPTPH